MGRIPTALALEYELHEEQDFVLLTKQILQIPKQAPRTGPGPQEASTWAE